MEQKVAAQNASLTIDGIAISKASNTVTDAIEGVTLNLVKANPDATTTLTVATDTSGVSKSVAGFVKAYNDLQASVTNLTKYDVANKKAAVLTGDSAPRIAQSQLRAIMGASLTASGLSLTSLSQVGVAFKADGTLGLDTAKLGAAIANDASGVARLFAAVGTATDSLVGVASTGAKTVPGSYAVNVTQLATRGNAVGSVAAGLTISAGVNDVLSVTIDGIAADVTLAAGTYANAAALAAEIQSKVNGAAALSTAGAKVSVTESAGVLTLTSQRYGSASTVAVTGNAATGLFGTPTTAAGVDVAGTIGGLAAVGSGQTLSGSVGRRHRRPGHHRRRRHPRCARRHRLHAGLRVEAQPGAHEPPRQRWPGHGQHRGHHQAHRGPQRPARGAEAAARAGPGHLPRAVPRPRQAAHQHERDQHATSPSSSPTCRARPTTASDRATRSSTIDCRR